MLFVFLSTVFYSVKSDFLLYRVCLPRQQVSNNSFCMVVFWEKKEKETVFLLSFSISRFSVFLYMRHGILLRCLDGTVVLQSLCFAITTFDHRTFLKLSKLCLIFTITFKMLKQNEAGEGFVTMLIKITVG